MAVAIVTVSKTVTLAATRVALSAVSLVVKEFEVQAKNANTGIIYLGDVTVASSNGRQLIAGESWSMASLSQDDKDSTPNITIDLANVYIDASVSGEGVILTYMTGR